MIASGTALQAEHKGATDRIFRSRRLANMTTALLDGLTHHHGALVETGRDSWLCLPIMSSGRDDIICGIGDWRRKSARSSPNRGNLHQTSLRQVLDQDVCQVRYRAAHRDHRQRRVVLQAPLNGRTPQRAADPWPRAGQEDHLQPDRPARDSARRQRRYLAHLSALDNFSAGVRAISPPGCVPSAA
jgi:hypothetical protein